MKIKKLHPVILVFAIATGFALFSSSVSGQSSLTAFPLEITEDSTVLAFYSASGRANNARLDFVADLYGNNVSLTPADYDFNPAGATGYSSSGYWFTGSQIFTIPVCYNDTASYNMFILVSPLANSFQLMYYAGTDGQAVAGIDSSGIKYGYCGSVGSGGGGGLESITAYNLLTKVGTDSVKAGGFAVENTDFNMGAFDFRFLNSAGNWRFRPTRISSQFASGINNLSTSQSASLYTINAFDTDSSITTFEVSKTRLRLLANNNSTSSISNGIVVEYPNITFPDTLRTLYPTARYWGNGLWKFKNVPTDYLTGLAPGLDATHEGGLIYNYLTNRFNYWDGSQFVELASSQEVADTATQLRTEFTYNFRTLDALQNTSLALEIGDRVKIDATGAEYLIQADSVAGYAVDSVAVVPVDSSYAVLSPINGYLHPQYFGAIANDTLPDQLAFNAMFNFIENIDLPDPDNLDIANFQSSISVNVPSGIYYIRDTVFLPEDYNVPNDKDYPTLHIKGYGATLYSDRSNVVQLFHAGKNGNDFSVLDRGDYSLFIEGLTFKAGGTSTIRSTVTGIFMGAIDYSTITRCKFLRVGTAIYLANNYGCSISELEIQQPLVRGIYVRSGWNVWDNVANPCNAGTTELTVYKCRVVGGYDATIGSTISHFDFNQTSGLTVKNCISEGVRPLYNMIINYDGNSCTNPTRIETMYFENASVPGSVDTNVNIWLKSLAYETILDNVYWNFGKPDTLIRIDNEAEGYLNISNINLPTGTTFTSQGAIATGGTWRTVELGIESNKSRSDMEAFIKNMFKPDNAQNTITVKGPNSISSTNIFAFNDIKGPSSNIGNNASFWFAGNLLFDSNTPRKYLGIRGGASGFPYIYRPNAIGFGDEGLIGNYSGVLGWDMSEVLNLSNSYPTPLYHIGIDTTGKAATADTENIFLDIGSSNEFRFYRNGTSKFEGYGQLNNTASNLSKTFGSFQGWATDGTEIELDSIPWSLVNERDDFYPKAYFSEITTNEAGAYITDQSTPSAVSGTQISGSNNAYGIISMNLFGSSHFGQIHMATEQRSGKGRLAFRVDHTGEGVSWGPLLNLWDSEDFTSEDIENWNTAYLKTDSLAAEIDSTNHKYTYSFTDTDYNLATYIANNPHKTEINITIGVSVGGASSNSILTLPTPAASLAGTVVRVKVYDENATHDAVIGGGGTNTIVNTSNTLSDNITAADGDVYTLVIQENPNNSTYYWTQY